MDALDGRKILFTSLCGLAAMASLGNARTYFFKNQHQVFSTQPSTANG